MKTINFFPSLPAIFQKQSLFLLFTLLFIGLANFRAVCQCEPGFSFVPPPPGFCGIVADPVAPDGTFNLWSWGDGTSNVGTGGNQPHQYTDCGIFNIVHTIQCDINGDGILDNVSSAPMQAVINIPVVSISSTVINPEPSCNETSTITYTLCRQLCSGMNLPVNGAVTLSVFIPQGLEVNGQTNFTWTTTLPANSIPLSPQCTSIVLTLKAIAPPPPPSNSFQLTMTPSSDVCVDFEPKNITNAISPKTPNLVVTKATSTPSVQPNGTAVFTITVQNQGTIAANNVKVIDKYPAGFIPISVPSGATIGGNMISISVSYIPVNGSVSFNLSFKVATLCATNMVNEAWALHPDCDFESAHVTASVTINLNGVPLITIPGGNISSYNIPTPAFLDVQGDLTIDQNTTFFNSILRMGNGVKIIIPTGNYVWIDNSRLHSCDKLWDGIKIMQDATIISDDSYIEDATYSIYLIDDGILQVSKTIFNRNYVSIYAPALGSSNQHNTAGWTFFGNTFQCSEALRPKFHNTNTPNIPAGAFNYAGIEGTHFSHLSINESGSSVTTFRDMKYGIKTKLSNVSVTKAKFINIQPGLYTGNDAYGIHATGSANATYFLNQKGWGMGDGVTASFENCHTGILGSQVNMDVRNNRMLGIYRGVIGSLETNKNFVIQNNKVFTSFTGIRLTTSNKPKSIRINGNSIYLTPGNILESSGISIHNTTASPSDPSLEHVRYNSIVHFGYSTGISLMGSKYINVFNNGISVNQPHTQTNGIRVSSGSVNRISFNHVWGDGEALSDDITSGILAFSSQPTLMCCDSVQNTYSGIRFVGLCNSQEEFKGNKFNTHFFGLHFTPTGVLEKQENNGNRWWGTYSGAGKMAIHEGGSNQAANSIFKIHIDLLPYMPPSVLLEPASGWFMPPQQPEGFFMCPNCNEVAREVTDFDEKIAAGIYQSPAYNDGMQWMSKRNLYEKLFQNPSLVGFNSSITNFYNQIGSTTIADLVEIENGIENTYLIEPNDAATLNAYDESILGHIETLEEIDSALHYADAAGQATLLNQKSTEMSALMQVMQQSSALWSTVESERLSAISQLASQNSTILTTSIREENEKTTNAIFLATFAQNIILLNETQVEQLEEIAIQCPLDGGNAVFAARGMLELAKVASFNDYVLCDEGGMGERSSEPLADETNQLFVLYPNPATTFLLVDLRGDSTGGEISIVDCLGNVALHSKIDEKKMLLNISTLPNGIYTCRYLKKNTPPFVQKFVILR